MPYDPGAGRMTEEMERTLAALRVKFTDGVDSRILFFEAALADLRAGADTRATARSIRDAAHGIAGLAPSLGFADVGAAAAETEMAWEHVAAAPRNRQDLDAAIAALDTLLDRLEATLEP